MTPCQFKLQASNSNPKAGEQTTISMDPPLQAPCTVEIRLNGVLINGSPSVQASGDFKNFDFGADGHVTVTAIKDGPGGVFVFKKTCLANEDSQGCGPTEMFIAFVPPRRRRHPIDGPGALTIFGASIITGAIIGGVAFGPLGAIAGGGFGGVVAVFILAVADLFNLF